MITLSLGKYIKRYGWNPWDMDYTTDNPETEDNGVRVQSGYTYEGNVKGNMSVAHGANARIRYEFVTSGFTLHAWTSVCTAAASLTIVP